MTIPVHSSRLTFTLPFGSLSKPSNIHFRQFSSLTLPPSLSYTLPLSFSHSLFHSLSLSLSRFLLSFCSLLGCFLVGAVFLSLSEGESEIEESKSFSAESKSFS